MRTLFVVCTLALLGSPAEPTPAAPTPVGRDAQFVDHDDYCVTDQALEPARNKSCQLAKMTEPADKNGVAKFDRGRPTASFVRSHIAKADELRVPMMVLVPVTDSVSDTPPKSREEALAARWEVARIVSLDEPGTALLVGLGNPVKRANLRVVEADPMPAVELASKEDRHWFHAEHWLVGEGEPPTDPNEAQGMSPAIALSAPAKPGEVGEFLVLHTGERVKTANAVRSRPASESELAAGVRVAMPEGRDELRDRRDSLRRTWARGPISRASRGVYYIGDYGAPADRLRVIVK